MLRSLGDVKMKEVRVLMISVFLCSFTLGIESVILPLYLRSIGATMFGIGIVFSLFEIFLNLSNIPIGKFCDKFGERITLLLSMALHSLTSFLYSFSSQVFHLEFFGVIRGLRGTSYSLEMISSRSIISRHEKRGEEIGKYTSSDWIGKGIGILLGGFFLVYLGLVGSFYLCATLTLLASVVVFLFLKADMSVKIKKKRFVFDKDLRRICILGFFIFFGVSLMQFVVPIYVFENIGALPHEISVILALGYLLSGSFQSFFGKLSDKIGRSPLILTGCFSSSLLRFLIPFYPHFAYFIIIWMLNSLFQSMSIPSFNALLLDSIKVKGLDLGIYNTFTRFGTMFGLFFSGVIADISFPYVFYLSGLFFSIVSIYIFAAMKT
jgi:MFS family permease